MKIAYMSGPVDAADVIEKWRDERRPDYFGTSYLSEFLNVSREFGFEPVVLTYRFAPSAISTVRGIRVYQIEREGKSGVRYHLESLSKILRTLPILLRERVSAVVVTEGAENGWLLAPLRLLGIKLIPALHGQLWSRFVTVKSSHRLSHWLNARLFYRGPLIAASGDIARQVDAPARVFLPTYQPFHTSPPPADGPFMILSAGRVEEDKGVFDLLQVARILKDRGLSFEMHFCGEGTQMDRLKRSVDELPVVIHGFCGREKLLDMFEACHAVVVATQSKLSEGFAMICAEGVLAGRPVVTSRACPALEYIADAAVEVEPDDIAGYADAFTRLMTDRAFYEAKVAATARAARQFLEPANGYGAALAATLLKVCPRLRSEVHSA